MPRWRCWTHDYQSLSSTVGNFCHYLSTAMTLYVQSTAYRYLTIVQYPWYLYRYHYSPGTYRPVIGTFSEKKISGSPDPLSGRGNNTVNTWHRTDPAVDQLVTRAGRYHSLPVTIVTNLTQPRKCLKKKTFAYLE